MKVFVAGSSGMVGSSIVNKLGACGDYQILATSSAELDLTDQKESLRFLELEKPDYVVVAAAKVGGILANDTYPAEFIYDNLMIECNLIHGSFLAGVERLLFLGSSCIYPKFSPQPIDESILLNGELEKTNEPYAVAKIAGIKLCESYNRQYGTDFRSLMPTNLYGPGDNYSLSDCHVIPALLARMHEAKISEKKSVVVWGSGTPLREFLYVDDLADACLVVLEADREYYWRELNPRCSHLNVGSGYDVSIAELVNIVRDVVEYDGEIVFDSSKPDGTHRKLLNSSRIEALGWSAQVDLRDGLERTYKNFLKLASKN